MSIQQLLRSTFNNVVEGIEIKRLFTGYGAFKNGMMFALYEKSGLFLRAENELVDNLLELGALHYQEVNPRHRSSVTYLHYYWLPKDILENKEMLKGFSEISIQQIQAIKDKKENNKKTRIKELVNLSIKHERLLAKVDIYTVEELQQVGAINAFIRLKKIGVDVNEQFFFVLHSALKNQNINTLSEADKQHLLLKLDTILKANGIVRVRLVRKKKSGEE